MKHAVHLYKHVADAAIKRCSGLVKVWNDAQVSGHRRSEHLTLDDWRLTGTGVACRHRRGQLIADQLMPDSHDTQ